ncbi:helix-turn-helix domain-containing protein [Microvirga guangxiensis]|uniref:Helix-turn-helix n=1 Tax=Microvirga guangxiensis TaxID=549386 RepID=A0A1G5G6D5_9HYPH|nr:helix-turn-helix transcriptional regulator [Microvirga guangxiensis]SCY47122.1 Helix-turn-helix [Microvirga guangxiensis]
MAKSTLSKSTHTTRYQRLLKLIIEARSEANLTQAKVADRLGKAQSQIASIESGGRRLDVVELLDLCEVIGLDPVKVVKVLRDTKEVD